MHSHREHSPYTGCTSSAHSTCSLSVICLRPVSPQSTRVAISIRLRMDQGRRTTMEATMDNTSSGWWLVLRADPLWPQTRPWNKMQVCSCQLAMYCLMLLWRRLQCRLAWWQHSNLPADFAWVVAASFLFMLWIYSVLSVGWIVTSE